MGLRRPSCIGIARSVYNRLRKVIGWALILGALPVLGAQLHTIAASWGRVRSVATAPTRPTVIVLGAKADPAGPSGFLAARLDVALDLYARGKVQRIIVSGDGREHANNEPLVMRRYLEQHGVPSKMIVEDPGGYDTYATCWRANEVYQVTSATLVTQDFHVRRAVTICRTLGMDVGAVPDTSVIERWPGIWARGVLREGLANVKMEIDLWMRRSPAAGHD